MFKITNTIDSNTSSCPVATGKVTVELNDAKTGEVQFKETQHNFITNKNDVKYNIQKVSDLLSLSSPPNSEVEIKGKNQTLVITDDGTEEDPETEIAHFGNLIGFARIRTSYSGTNEFQGSYNGNESYEEFGKEVFVYDFPTNAANGTFQSIGFINYASPTNVLSRDDSTYAYCPIIYFSELVPIQITSKTNMRIIGNFMYIYEDTANNPVYKVNLTTKDVSVVFTSTQAIISLDYNGTNYLAVNNATGSNSKIFELNSSGTIIKTITSPIPSMTGCLYDGDNYWVCSYSVTTDSLTGLNYNKTMYKLDSSGNIIDFICPSNYSNMFSFNSDIRISSMYKTTKGFMLQIQYKYGTTNYYGGIILIENDGNDYKVSFLMVGKGVTSSGYNRVAPYDINKGLFYIIDSTALYVQQVVPLISRVCLATPQKKLPTQTMKVTYEINYSKELLTE